MPNFEDLYLRVISERYYRYTMPEDKSLTMYDFYVLDYLNSILDHPSPSFRDLPSDLADSVRDAVNNLYPALREELLNAVFYAICAEIRHLESYRDSNEALIKEYPEYVDLYQNWKKYQIFHSKGQRDKDELTNIFGVEKPSSTKRIPETERVNDSRRNLSYKAANYAIQKTGSTEADFVRMCEMLYNNGQWQSSYGGRAWGNICSGWLMLNDSDTIKSGTIKSKTVDYGETKTEWDKRGEAKKEIPVNKKPMGVAIDHIYDLQHNTDTVFNKLKSYYNDGYGWIKKALDDKANVKSYYELLNKCSGTIKTMAIPVLHNKLGSTWQKEMKIEKPEPSVESPVETSVESPDTNHYNYKYTSRYLYKHPDILPEVGDIVKYTGDGNKVELHIKKFENGNYTYNVHKNGVLVTPSRTYPLTFMKNFIKGVLGPTFTNISLLKKNPAKKSEAVQETEPTPTINGSELSEGDNVECIDDKNLPISFKITKGKVYKILEISNNSVLIKDDNDKNAWLRANRFKKVIDLSQQPEPKFRKGDIVECVDPNGVLTKGKHYIIDSIFKYGNGDIFLRIVSDNGNLSSFFPERFKLVTQQENITTTNPELKSEELKSEDVKVGDMVECIDVDNISNGGKLTLGKTYTVVRVNYNNVVVIDDDNVKKGYFPSRFKLVDAKPVTPKEQPDMTEEEIQVGDRVECIDPGPLLYNLTLGKVYKVLSVYGSYVDIINDVNIENSYFMDRFVKSVKI